MPVQRQPLNRRPVDIQDAQITSDTDPSDGSNASKNSITEQIAALTAKRQARQAAQPDKVPHDVEPPWATESSAQADAQAEIDDDPEGAGYGEEEEPEGTTQKPPVAEPSIAPVPATVPATDPTPIASIPVAAPPAAPTPPSMVPAVQSPAVQPPATVVAPAAATAPARPTLMMGEKGFEINNLEQLSQFAGFLAASSMLPKAFQRSGNDDAARQQQRANIGIALMWGRELGLSAMASLNGIAVINNTPSIWGDALPGLCYSSGVLQDHEEFWEGEGQSRVAVCRVLRKGQGKWHEQRFGYADAQRAGLLNKDTYKNYPDRMCMNRARAFAFRTKFADVLRGLPVAEEVQDYAQPQPAQAAIPAEASAPKFSRLEKESAQ